MKKFFKEHAKPKNQNVATSKAPEAKLQDSELPAVEQEDPEPEDNKPVEEGQEAPSQDDVKSIKEGLEDLAIDENRSVKVKEEQEDLSLDDNTSVREGQEVPSPDEKKPDKGKQKASAVESNAPEGSREDHLDEEWVENTIREKAATNPMIRWTLLANAGAAWYYQYEEVSQDPQHLDRAIQYFKRSLDVTDPPKSVMATINLNDRLSDLLVDRFEKSSNVTDIDDAIKALEIIVKLTDELAEADVAFIGKNISILACARLCRFKKIGDRENLSSAIEGFQTALALLEDDPSPNARYLITNCLVSLCHAATRRFENDGDEDDLQLAIESGQKAVDSFDEDDPMRGSALPYLSIAIFKQEKLPDIENAIKIGREALRYAVQNLSHEEGLVVRQALGLGAALWEHYLSRPADRIDDLNEVIQIYEQAIAHLDPVNPDFPEFRHRLDEARHQKAVVEFEENSKTDKALPKFEIEFISRKPEEEEGKYDSSRPPKRSRAYFDEGVKFQQDFLDGRLFKDIDDAVNCFREAIDFDDTIYPEEVMFSFSTALVMRFSGPNKLEDLDYGMETMQRSLKMVRNDSPLYFLSLSSLCSFAHLRYWMKFNVEDLDFAIKMGEEALEAGRLLQKPGQRNPRATAAAVLCCAYMSRVKRALKRSMKTFEKFQVRRFPFSAIMDIDRAVELGERATDWMKDNEDSTDFAERILEEALELQELAMNLREGRDEEEDDDEELQQSVSGGNEYEKAEEGLQNLMVNVGMPDWLIPAASGVGISEGLKQRAGALKQTRQVSESEISVSLAESEIYKWTTSEELTFIPLLVHIRKPLPNDSKSTRDHLNFAEHLYVFEPMHIGVLNLLAFGMSHRRNFEVTGIIKDLDRAGTAFKRCTELLGFEYGTPNISLILRNWGEIQHARFVASMQSKSTEAGALDLSQLDEASLKLERALELLSSDCVDHIRANVLKTLSDILTTRFEISRTPLTDISWYANNEWDVETRKFEGLDSLFGSLFGRKVDDKLAQKDINRAVTCLREAVKLMKLIPGFHAMYSWHLAKALGRRAGFTKSEEDRDEAIWNLELVSKNPMVPIYCRISAANSGVRLLLRSNDLHRAKDFAALAVELLPLLQFTENAAERRKRLTLYRGMTAQAVSLSIACGDDPYRSLQLSEIGRGVVNGDEMNNRYISNLQEIDPDLAKRFQDLNEELRVNIAEPSQLEGFGGGILTTDYDGVMSQYEDAVEQIRLLPGFEGFLNAPSESLLPELVYGGSLVLVNVSEMSSDAILVTSKGISICNLKDLALPVLRKKAQDFVREAKAVPREKYAKSTESVKSILEWLWDVLVSPVLEQLGHTKAPAESEAWPRVWWVATGVLSFLPVHAAGYHDEKSGRTAMDRVICSYVPTTNLLAYSMACHQKTPDEQELRATLLSMPNTPGCDDLPFVEEEFGTVISLLQEIEPVIVEENTESNLLAALKENQLAHVICHGELSLNNPTNCQLLLDDWKTKPLSVEDVSKIKNKSGQLAYLTVCPKSDIFALRPTDESIQFSSSFLLAGFPSIIECLPSHSNENCVGVARLVYEHLLGDEKKFDPRNAAGALHQAIRSLRDSQLGEQGTSDPIAWVRFTHTGI